MTDSGSNTVVGGTNGTNGYHIASRGAYSLPEGTRKARERLLKQIKGVIPAEIIERVKGVQFRNAEQSLPQFPCPFKEAEAIGALKSVEAGLATAIADAIRGGHDRERKAEVDLRLASCFLFSAYLATIGGYGKADVKSKPFLKNTDLHEAQSVLYRRLSANLYSTKNAGEYFHLHGSLEATTSLNMIGLSGHDPGMTDYHEIINRIENHVQKFTAAELEVMNEEKKQAGVTCLKPEDFRHTEHGKALISEPPFRISSLENASPPCPFPGIKSQTPKPQILSGIKVLELCRIIAGPSIGKGLAEYGASVLKISSASLPDVPFFQVDVNVGKHCAELNLKDPADRMKFETLLQDADVIIDGYSPGSLSRLGYGPEQTCEMAKSRGRGIVYVSENCFGYVGPWSSRRGWQQIADCVTGIAWEQGRFMGLDEPVVPPFPMSDYGTGCLGTIAALTGLYLRARDGGSYHGTTSLCQYDLFLLSLGLHEKNVQKKLKEVHDPEFFELRHADSVDEVGKRALKSMKRVHKELFDARTMGGCLSQGYGGHLQFVKPVVSVEGTWNGWVRNARPNGFDNAGWEGWEFDQDVVRACKGGSKTDAVSKAA